MPNLLLLTSRDAAEVRGVLQGVWETKNLVLVLTSEWLKGYLVMYEVLWVLR